MQQPETDPNTVHDAHNQPRPLSEQLSRSLLAAAAIALLVTASGLVWFAQRNIGQEAERVRLLADMESLVVQVQQTAPVLQAAHSTDGTASTDRSATSQLIAELQTLAPDPFRTPLRLQLQDARGNVVFDSLGGWPRLMDWAQKIAPRTGDPVWERPLSTTPPLQLRLTANPLGELREAAENLSVALGALLTLTMVLYVNSRRQLRRAFSPLRDITSRLQSLEGGASDEPPLRAQGTGELDRIAQSVNHLQAELARQNSLQREWMNRLQDLQESERRQIAAELHDELGQHLTALNVDAATLLKQTTGDSRLQAVAQAMQDNSQTLLRQLRGLLGQLRPVGLDGAEDQTRALHDSLHRLVDQWRSRLPDTELTLDLKLPDWNMPSRLSLTTFRLVQEALTNAARHADARHIEVNVYCDADIKKLCIVVCDDGTGPPPEAADAAPRSLQERVRANGGTIVFEAASRTESDAVAAATAAHAATDGTEASGQTHPAAKASGWRVTMCLPMYRERPLH